MAGDTGGMSSRPVELGSDAFARRSDRCARRGALERRGPSGRAFPAAHRSRSSATSSASETMCGATSCGPLLPNSLALDSATGRKRQAGQSSSLVSTSGTECDRQGSSASPSSGTASSAAIKSS